jgi:hypothetical protein
MNNPYLTAVQEIKKGCKITWTDKETGTIMYCRQDYGKLYLCDNCQAKLQTAVEFLQMTKEDKESRIDDISKEQILRKYFYKKVRDGYIFDIPINPREQEILIKDIINGTIFLTKEKELENINSALKEVGENNG